MVPHVPLVEGQVDGVFTVLLALDAVADGHHGFDEFVHVQGAGQEIGGVPGGVGVVAVQ